MGTGESDIAPIVVEGVYEGTLGHLDKRWWWRDWLKPILFYLLPLIPFIYLTGWYLGYF
jgi:hypothetical protein